MLSFPNICIISPLKAYFDYVAKPFVTINKISISGTVLYSASYSPPVQLQDDVHIVIQKKEIRRTS